MNSGHIVFVLSVYEFIGVLRHMQRYFSHISVCLCACGQQKKPHLNLCHNFGTVRLHISHAY